MRVFFIALALLFVFPFNVGASDSKTTPQTTSNKPERKAREKTANGVVKAVDTAAGIIVIKSRDELIFTADESLLKEINVNDKVIIKYTEVSGKKCANSIKLESKKRTRR